MYELSIKFPSTKKQKNLNAGILFKKAQDEIHGQTLNIFDLLKIGNIQFFDKIRGFVLYENTYYNMKEAWTLGVILAINLKIDSQKKLVRPIGKTPEFSQL